MLDRTFTDKILSLLLISLGLSVSVKGQELPERSLLQSPYTSFWQQNYANFRLSEKFFWHAELHLRTTAHDGVPFMGKMSKWYNRHGLKYLHSKNFSATLGGVLRFNFTPDPGNDEYHAMTPEYRIWHQYSFALPFSRFMAYHRIRIEHRWDRSNLKGADFIFRNRWRYKFQIKYPINKKKLEPGAFYMNPDAELIMQSGKEVVDSPLEDLRLFLAVGYIINPRIKLSTGAMYSMGQKLDAGYKYRRRWIPRFHMYYSFDIRKKKRRGVMLRD